MGRRNQAEKTGLTESMLRDLYEVGGLTDKEIGQRFSMSDAAISYFRRKWHVATRTTRQRADTLRDGPTLEELTPARLAEIYSTMGDRGIAKLYGVSKPTIRSLRLKMGVQSISKSDRSTSDAPLSIEQKELVLGTLLGDAHLLERGVLKVTHYQEQAEYLTRLHKALCPHALPIYYEEKEMENGRLTFAFGFQTVCHDWLKAMRGVFYPSGKKILPESVLRDLSPRSLAYWYFDDGHLDSGLPSFALGDIPEDMLQDVVRWVSTRFEIEAYASPRSTPSCQILGVRGKSADKFFALIKEFTSQDMLYKIPAKHWPFGSIPSAPLRTPDEAMLPKGLVEEARAKIRDWATLPESEQSTLVEAFAEFWGRVGFPYHTIRAEELTTLSRVEPFHVIQGGIVKARQVGQGVCQGIARHIWSASSHGAMSPIELFSNPDTLREVLRFCFRMGQIPNAARLRGALRFWKRGGVYNFRPSAAKALVDRYCRPGGTVLDPCAGYGGRLLGTLVSGANASYVACEPSTETHDALVRLTKWLTTYIPDAENRVTLHPQPAEDTAFPQDVDVVMTSPPYWKREVYADEDTQSARRYGTYAEWLDGFWAPTLRKGTIALRPGGWLLLNVDDFSLNGRDYPLIQDTIRIVQGLGFGKYEKLIYDMPGPSQDGRGEVILCWAKVVGVCYDSPSTMLTIPRCTQCGKAVPPDVLLGGYCEPCRTPAGHDVECRGCRKTFRAMNKGRRFHDDACYQRHRRAQERAVKPPPGIRTFTCTLCSKTWETRKLGRFTVCTLCKEAEDVARRKKTCQYRHCRTTFTDTSHKQTMKYCSPEHRRREKLFRTGIATDESYFRSSEQQPVSRHCLSCRAPWFPVSGDKNNRCHDCRAASRHKKCPTCGIPFRDDSENNTRRYCLVCSPSQGEKQPSS